MDIRKYIYRGGQRWVLVEANGDKGGGTVTSSAAEIFVTERTHLGQLSAYHILVSQSALVQQRRLCSQSREYTGSAGWWQDIGLYRKPEGEELEQSGNRSEISPQEPRVEQRPAGTSAAQLGQLHCLLASLALQRGGEELVAITGVNTAPTHVWVLGVGVWVSFAHSGLCCLSQSRGPKAAAGRLC